MADQKIEFRKIRDFGENLNESFSFIRLNFKPLLGSFFAICSLFMLSYAVYRSFYQSKVFTIFDKLQKGTSLGKNPFMDMVDANYFITIGLGVLSYVSMKVAFNAYIKFQLEHDNRFPAIDDVWIIFRKNFFKVLVYTLLLWFIAGALMGVVAALVFIMVRAAVFTAILLVPAMLFGLFYFVTVFTPFTAIVMLEDADFSSAFGRCFDLIKNNFWSSFGVYCIGYVIYGVSGSIIGLLFGLITGMTSYVTTDKVDSSMQIAASFFNIFTNIFFIVFLVSSTFQYFTLTEKKDGTGMLRRISNIGIGNNNFDNTEEQY